MTKTYEIPIIVTIEYPDNYIFAEAKLIGTIIRDKIRKSMDNQSSIKKWTIDLPNESNLTP